MSEPEVSVPAFMRNYHEVVRNDLGRLLAPLLEAGDVAAFATWWQAYEAAISVHAAMEDGVAGAGGGIAALLDLHFDGAAHGAAFRDEHHYEHEARAAVAAALGQDLDALRQAFHHYQGVAEEHLVHEEDIWMPLVARLPEPRAPKFAEWCVSAGIATGGFDHFVAHGVMSLSAFGSTKHTPQVATRVFVQSLQAVCTPQQWTRYLPIARGAASPDVWAAVVAEAPSLEP